MKFSESFEIFKLAAESIKSNKLRAGLASLGVVIGISFVIIMGWILAGLDSVLEDTISAMGTDMLYVDKWEWGGGRNWKLMEQRKIITLEQANELCEKLTTAEYAMPMSRRMGASIKYGDESLMGMSILGTRSDYGLIPSGEVVQGRFFASFEDQYSEKVVVIGWGVYKSLFEQKDIDPIDKYITINGRNFRIIGVLKKQGTMMMDFIDNQMAIPLKTYLGIFGSFNRGFSIAVKAGSTERMANCRSEIEGNMRIIRNLYPGEDNDFAINETKTFEDNIATFRMYVWGIGIGMTVLSFIVGIIGIMNIMFVSVTERTKEIGIRKAIGARKRSILLQFIMESSALCLVGAIVSFVLCSVLIYAAATILPKFLPSMSFLSPYMPIQLLVIASIVSIFVGVFAGVIPAYRASSLDPVDALRYE